MGKSTHFIGQPLYSQVIKLLCKSKILQISENLGGERYTKRFNAWIHMVVMLYAVIKRFDSLREITTSLLADTHKLAHIGITFKIGRSTLADANRCRPQAIFEAVYRDLYSRYRHELISDSRRRKHPKWMDKLQIIDSTTITLFSNLIFKGVGRHPKSGKKKGGIKVHTVIHANEGVPVRSRLWVQDERVCSSIPFHLVYIHHIVRVARRINYTSLARCTMLVYYTLYIIKADCGATVTLPPFILPKPSAHTMPSWHTTV